MQKKTVHQLCYWLKMDLRKMNEIIQQHFIGDQSDLTVIDRKWKRPSDRPTVFQTPMHKRKETRTRMRTRLTQFIIGRMQFMSFIFFFIRKKRWIFHMEKYHTISNAMKKPWHSAINMVGTFTMELVSMIIQRSFVLILFSHKYIYINEIQCKWSLAA